MVVLLDLEDEGLEPEEDAGFGPFASFRLRAAAPANDLSPHPSSGNGEPSTHIPPENEGARGFSAALACYPVVRQLATSLDLNTLHALSRTCRQIRCNLLPLRKQLIPRTLRCSTELADAGEEVASLAGMRRYHSWDVVGSFGIAPTRITSGNIGPCARDMVGECRRCGRVVCRNCITKLRFISFPTKRHRRLCTACASSPLPELARAQQPCSCATDMAYLCQPCGHAISNSDVNYSRIWEWRTRYSMGGLGTGIGEGDQGVKCARAAACLAAQDVEKEIDSSEEDLSMLVWVEEGGEGGEGGEVVHQEPVVAAAVGEEKGAAGYLRQEIEGIGGVVRKKVRKRLRVGRAVREWEDEREGARYLAREAEGRVRSWCGWCDRVIVGKREEGIGA